MGDHRLHDIILVVIIIIFAVLIGLGHDASLIKTIEGLALLFLVHAGYIKVRKK